MAVAPGFQTTIKVSGTPTAFTGAATTALAADSLGRARRQITTAANRILDPNSAVTVKDNAVAVSAANIAGIDYTTGIVTFVGGYTFVGAITVDGSYLPLLTVAEGRSYSIKRSRTRLDTTTFEHAASTKAHRTSLGRLIADVDLELLDADDTDLDAGAGTVVLQTLMDQATPKLLEIQLATGWYFRCWVLFPSIEKTSEEDGLMRQRVLAESCSVSTTGNNFGAHMSVAQ